MSIEPRAMNHVGGMPSLRWWRMTQKELREILRDRRTILTLIGMPLLIYPLLGVTFQKLFISQAMSRTKTEYRIAFADRHDSQVFAALFRQAELLQLQKAGIANPMEHKPAGSPDDPMWEFIVSKDLEKEVDIDELVADRSAEVGIRLHPSGESGPWNFEMTYRAGSLSSLDARRAIEDRLRLINDVVISRRLHDIDPPIVLPIELSHHPVVTSDAAPSFTMATLIPLILILMTVTGAVYPAIDLTAGERERGTLEALISAPVPRHELLFAKFLAVLTVAILTAIANLTSMVITAYSSGMEQLLFGSAGINGQMLALMLGLLIVFAGFFTSVILILTSFARSFKEAQAYLIPVMLVSMAPGVLCLLPGIEMSAWMSVTPLVNIVILARDVFDGRAQPVWVLAALLSTVLYSAVALAAAARIFGTDAVLYGSEGSWADLFRRPTTPQPSPTLSQAMACLAVMVPGFLILSGLPARFAGNTAVVLFAGNAVITIALFALVPLAFARWSAVDIRNGFSLYPAAPISFLAAFLLGLSLWPFAIELAKLQPATFLENETTRDLFEKITTRLDAIPIPLRLLALAVIPAVCEEMFFRGYLFAGLRTGMSTPLAIAFSSCLFGLFHVIPNATFERFVPTCFLGLILATICFQTGSVLPGMLLHVTHNSLLLLMQANLKKLIELGIGTGAEQHVPLTWLAAAAAVIGLAAGMMIVGSQRRSIISLQET